MVVKKLLSVNWDSGIMALISQLRIMSCHAWFEWSFGLVLYIFKNNDT